MQCTGKVRRKLIYSALSRTVLYCAVRWGGFNNQVSGRSGAEYRKPSKTSRSIGFANAVCEDFEWLAKPWVGDTRPQGFASHSKSSKIAVAKPILREVFDGFLYSAPDPPETWLLNPHHRTVQYNTVRYSAV